MDKIAQIKAANATANAAAALIDTSRTDPVTAAEIEVGDVLISLGKVTFPFPVTISRITQIPNFGLVMLVATNGWFSGKPIRVAETAVRVAR